MELTNEQKVWIARTAAEYRHMDISVPRKTEKLARRIREHFRVDAVDASRMLTAAYAARVL
jgi:hypothetical protein